MWITNGVMNGIEAGDAFLCYAKTSSKDVSLFLVEKVLHLIIYLYIFSFMLVMRFVDLVILYERE